MKRLTRLIISILYVSLFLPNQFSDLVPSSPQKQTIKQISGKTNPTIYKERFIDFVDIQEKEILFDKHSCETRLQEDFLNGRINEKKFALLVEQAEFLEETASTLTGLAMYGQGTIDSDGCFIPYHSGTEPIVSDAEKAEHNSKIISEQNNDIQDKIEDISEFENKLTKLQLTPFLLRSEPYDFWNGWKVTFGASGSLIMGILGLVLNIKDWTDQKNWKPTPKEILTGSLEDSPSKTTILATIIAGNPAFQELLDYTEKHLNIGDILSWLTSSFLLVFSVMRIVFNSSGLGWIFELILLLIQNHFPSAPTGMNMLVSGFFEMSPTDSHMHLLWSDFTVLDPVFSF